MTLFISIDLAVGILKSLHNFFINAFEPSSLEAFLLGPKTLYFFFSKKSTIPFTNGSSGPTISRFIFFFKIILYNSLKLL